MLDRSELNTFPMAGEQTLTLSGVKIIGYSTNCKQTV